MRRFSIAAVVAALVVTGSATDTAVPQQTTPPPATAPAATPAPPVVKCEVTQVTHNRAVRRLWRYSHRGGNFLAGKRPSKKEIAKLGEMRSCAKSERAAKLMRRYMRNRVATWRYHRYIDRITPYGAWAKPVILVQCEGGVNGWNISNYEGSGANGPYQLLGKREPWPVRTWRDMARHHEIAAGLGLSHWLASNHCHHLL